MLESESREYFTLQESDGSACTCVQCKNPNNKNPTKRGRHRKSHQKEQFIIDGPLGNIFITPVKSNSSHKYKTPYSSSCHSGDNEDLWLPKSPRGAPHHHQKKADKKPRRWTRSKSHRRSRSLCIHISPARKNCHELGPPPLSSPTAPAPQRSSRTVKCDDCRRAQVAQVPCHSKWGPVYQPPPSSSQSKQFITPPTLAQRGDNENCDDAADSEQYPNQSSQLKRNRTCPVYQPELEALLDTLDLDKDEIYPERVAQNLCEDRRCQPHHDETTRLEQSAHCSDADETHLCDDEQHQKTVNGGQCVSQNEWKSDDNDDQGHGQYDLLTDNDDDPQKDQVNSWCQQQQQEDGQETILYRHMITMKNKRNDCCPEDDQQSIRTECHDDHEAAAEEELPTNFFGNDDLVHFRPVHDLPKPAELREWANSQRQRQENHYSGGSQQLLCCEKDKIVFPFRRTPSGNLKICRDQVAFQSKQVAVLVNDPRRTRVRLKQERDCPPPPPPPIPPLCFDDLPSPPRPPPACGSSRRPKSEHRHHHNQHQVNPDFGACSGQKASKKSCTRPPPCDSISKKNKESKQENLQESSAEPPLLLSCLNLQTQTQNQCRNSTEFIESLHHRLRRAIHPDTKVVIGCKEFPCHSLALQAYSKYFDSIKRPSDTIHRIILPEEIIRPQDFPNVMDWILLDESSKSLVISKDNVVALYVAAQCLGIPGLKEHCLGFINEKLEACDPLILQLYEDARRKSTHCKDLLFSLAPKLAHLFPIVYKSRQFLTLAPDDLIMLIDSDDVKIESELDIYDAAARWLLYDWSIRGQYAVRVMKCVRFGLLSPLQLTQIRHCADVANMPDYSHIYSFQEIKDLLCNGLTYAIFKDNYKSRPGEFNKWVDWSKVDAPRPRYNANGNPDVFRLPAKIPVDGYPNYDMKNDTSENQEKEQQTFSSCNKDENEKSTPHHCSSNTAVRDEGHGSSSEAGRRVSPPRPRPSPRSMLASPRKHQTTPRPIHPSSFKGQRQCQGDSPQQQQDDPSSDHNKKSKTPPTTAEVTDTFERMSENIIEDPYDYENEVVSDSHQENQTIGNQQSQTFEPTTTRAAKSPATSSNYYQNISSTLSSPRKKAKNLLLEDEKYKPTVTRYGKIHHRAATKIQATFKAHLIRNQYLQMKNAATVIQSGYRNYKYRHQKQRKKQLYSATTIQRGVFNNNNNNNKVERVQKLLIPGKEVVIVFGGMNPQQGLSGVNTCRHVYRFNPEENLWADMGQMPEPRSHCGVVCDQKSVMVFGGSDPRNPTPQGRNIPSSSCWSLDPLTGKWRTLPSMRIARTNFGYCKWRGKIFVFGGKDVNGQALSSCEKFDPTLGDRGRWDLIPPMQVPCMSMAVSKFGDKIFVVGGVSMMITGRKRPILKTVLVFEPKTNSWSHHQTPLKYGRCYAQLASRYSQLFLVGGAGKLGPNGGTQSLQDVTVFEDGEWEQVGTLKKARHGHAMVKIGKHFLIMGGVSSESMEPLDTVEIYNIETNRASSKVSVMPQKLTGMTAVVL